MRVKQSLASINNDDPPEERQRALRQQLHATSLANMATNTHSTHCEVLTQVNENESILLLDLPAYFLTSQKEEAITWLFDGSFEVDKCINSVVLAANNLSVNAWNSYIQGYNENPEFHLRIPKIIKILELHARKLKIIKTFKYYMMI